MWTGFAHGAGRPSPSIDMLIPGPALGGARSGSDTVVSIEYVGVRPVYNMEVPSVQRFSIAGGLLVHNCIDAIRYALGPLIRRRDFTPVRVRYA